MALEVDLEDAGHARERDHDPVGDGQRAAREPGAGAARDEGNAFPVTGADDGLHVLGRARQDDERGERAPAGEAVAVVDTKLGGVGDHVLAAEGVLQLACQPVRQHAPSIAACFRSSGRGRSCASGSTTVTTPRSRARRCPRQPLFFAKFPTSLIGPGEAIVIPPFVTQCDYEAELGVVIGERVKDISRESAFEAVRGYLCANDVTARDLQFGDKQWTRGKSIDTFCPVGPASSHETTCRTRTRSASGRS